MYGVGGERRLDEYELGWLRGYEGSAPVRVGNAASGQRQLDVYGEVADTIYRARRLGMAPAPEGVDPARGVVRWLKDHWREPDDGIWEVRGPRRQFVHSKVMAWVAADRVVKMSDESGQEGAVEGLRQMRDDIHEEVCRKGYDAERNTFTQYYGSTQLDAALLLIPQVGFLPATDPRVAGTVETIQRELVHDGFVMRYIPDKDAADGLPPGKARSSPAASGWSTPGHARETEEPRRFSTGCSLRNDLGLFREYDQEHQRLIGNFPRRSPPDAHASAVALTEAGVRRATAGTMAGPRSPPPSERNTRSVTARAGDVTEVGATLRTTRWRTRTSSMSG
jgi:hypothetical protein